ncbi:hypothetical protein [Lysobacter sp. Root604]|uniref:hypothetical protein n=1 Tax=Lysobacter sp. Root604 TaxID=1736568 RepID=UPI0012FC245C|nr:hypothetical protein [Lysobacter sp. Root604]
MSAYKGKILKVHTANGDVIGEITSTGDPLEDAKLADELFNNLGLGTKKDSAALSIRKQARSFSKVTHHIYDTIGLLRTQSAAYLAPFVTNAAFALELYIKALAREHGTSLRGHKLADLYRGLPQAAIEEIAIAYLAVESRHDLEGAQPDIELFLTEINDAFVEWRYAYENKSGLSVKVNRIMFLLDTLDLAGQRIV